MLWINNYFPLNENVTVHKKSKKFEKFLQSEASYKTMSSSQSSPKTNITRNENPNSDHHRLHFFLFEKKKKERIMPHWHFLKQIMRSIGIPNQSTIQAFLTINYRSQHFIIQRGSSDYTRGNTKARAISAKPFLSLFSQPWKTFMDWALNNLNHEHSDGSLLKLQYKFS